MAATRTGVILFIIGIVIWGYSATLPLFSPLKTIIDMIGWIPILFGLWVLSVKLKRWVSR